MCLFYLMRTTMASSRTLKVEQWESQIITTTLLRARTLKGQTAKVTSVSRE